ncbi:zinc ribbon domain-containing protein [Paraburkholderia saeva]|uniref:zinc ribbon domain-containing protein n=1 Tax=Paraburkholderia saeva TaxID=2777537 RepID=UPI001E495ED2|nr:zinc-ribbon domain-containing protein [Paraburkholderia saeva]
MQIRIGHVFQHERAPIFTHVNAKRDARRRPVKQTPFAAALKLSYVYELQQAVVPVTSESRAVRPCNEKGKEMALKKCRECGTEVSDQAKICPKCGIKNPVKRMSLLAKIALGLLALVVIGNVLPRLMGHRDNLAPSAPATPAIAASTSASAPAQVAEETPASAPVQTPANWNYEQREDDMQKGTNRFAYVVSTNDLTFNFPYNRAQHARLLLRKHVRFGNDVILSVERGQFLCHINSCSVTIRFDDGAGVKYSATEPESNSSTALFIQPYNKFYAAMLKAKRVRIEATFFQEGNRTMDFDVSGFDAAQL